MLYIWRSNRMERLASALSATMQEAPRDPFTEVWVVVHSAGMARWLEMEIAEALGICSNVRFLLPSEFIWEVSKPIVEDESPPLDPSSFTFAILEVLPTLSMAPQIRAYLEAGPKTKANEVTRREMLLASRLAWLFDRYMAFRPDVLERWERGAEEQNWQAILWRALNKNLPGMHPAQRGRRFIAYAQKAKFLPALPDRFYVFGSTTLPPFYCRILEALARHKDVFLFVFSPSKEFFGDIVPFATKAKADEEALSYLEVGHPLLASFGRLSKDFQMVLSELQTGAELDLFEDPAHEERPTALKWLQSDILHLRYPTGPSRHPISPSDDSIRIHACHGPMRQVEVLRDQILDLLARYPDLTPADIVVMAPDIEAYAPFIEAVFGEDALKASGLPKIPYSIADRKASGTNRVALALLKVLDLSGSRLEASKVLDLLTLEPVCTRFGLTPEDLDEVRSYVEEARIYFGLDGAHRASLGLPGYEENTWRFGLDRLLLGAAMEDVGVPFKGLYPCDLMQGPSSPALCGFVAFCEALFRTLADFSSPKTLSEWTRTLEKALKTLISDEGEFREEGELVRRVLLDLATKGEALLTRLIQVDAIKVLLEGALHESRSLGLFRGGVTFCEMVPLRSLPFKVVALLGMDDETFPRKGIHLDFDLLEKEHRTGDRNPREDDLQLFLEALLSARNHLIITYSGMDVRTNERLPPAVPVGELLDCCDKCFVLEGSDRSPRDIILIEHPLQPFSPRNFDPSSPRSYDKRYLRAAKAVINSSTEPRLPFTTLLPLPKAPKVSIDALVAFLKSPVQYFLRFHGFDPEISTSSLKDRETLEPDGLERYELAKKTLALALEGHSYNQIFERLRGLGMITPGKLGLSIFHDIWERVQGLLEIAGPLLEGEARPIEVAIDFGEGRILRGHVRHVYPSGIVHLTPSKPKATRLLDLWVRHLAASAQDPSYPGRAFLLGLDNGLAYKKTLKPLGDNFDLASQKAKEFLQGLIDLFFLGLRYPLPLFPETSMAFAENPSKWKHNWWQEKGDEDEGSGERSSRAVQFAFGDYEDPTKIWVPEGVFSFEELANLVFSPLITHLEGSEVQDG